MRPRRFEPYPVVGPSKRVRKTGREPKRALDFVAPLVFHSLWPRRVASQVKVGGGSFVLA
jgi:hypothetical protein